LGFTFVANFVILDPTYFVFEAFCFSNMTCSTYWNFCICIWSLLYCGT